MGEAKRRKDALGEKYGKEPTIYPWLPMTQSQADRFMKWTTRGAWYGITFMVLYWITVRFIGPSLGWWHVI